VEEGRTGERGVGRVRPRALDADDDDDDQWRRQQRRRRAADRGADGDDDDDDEEAGGCFMGEGSAKKPSGSRRTATKLPRLFSSPQPTPPWHAPPTNSLCLHTQYLTRGLRRERASE
jgi:hypothetical protein